MSIHSLAYAGSAPLDRSTKLLGQKDLKSPQTWVIKPKSVKQATGTVDLLLPYSGFSHANLSNDEG